MDRYPSLPVERRRLLCEEGQSRIGFAPATRKRFLGLLDT